MATWNGCDTNGVKDFPLAYLITFTCYGTWLHGEEAGSVDRDHNIPGTPFLETDTERAAFERSRMKQPPYELDVRRRRIVLQTLLEVCQHRGWYLFAAHVRTKHVHAVVQAAIEPEEVMNDWKAYASRNLNRAGVDTPQRKRWTRHGSTRYLWDEEAIERAVHYVLYEQGELMEVYPPLDSKP
jgi:REP element-mobilizing transposase RayT